MLEEIGQNQRFAGETEEAPSFYVMSDLEMAQEIGNAPIVFQQVKKHE